MNEVKIFNNKEFGNITTIKKDGEPWFIGKDVASALGYKNTAKAIKDHCKYMEILKNNDTVLLEIAPRGLQIINEGDLYRLIMRSDLPSAVRFQDWVMEEILPSIKKHGMYATNDNLEEMLADPDTMIKTLQALKEERLQKRLHKKMQMKNKKLSNIKNRELILQMLFLLQTML